MTNAGNCRIVCLQGADEFNIELDGVWHQERIRPDRSWIVDRKVADALMESPLGGFVERYDDGATLREILTLASVLQDQPMRVAIGAAIQSRNMRALP
jgi:hypothetical protein